MFELKTYLQKERLRIEKELTRYIKQLCPSERMQPPLLHAVLAGGKRLRPILCLAACDAVGADSAYAMPAACAIEMIHTYSLIHDDLPALDDDDLRRGQPTCHRQFDEATAILSGDALLTMAFEVLSEAGLQSSGPAGRQWMQVIQVVAHASGCRGMIEGQVRDLTLEGVRIKPDELQALHRLKTGALIRASVHCGALLGNGTVQQIDHMISYSDDIGLAFQVVDDVLNVTGDPHLLGKAVGSDQIRRKNTYPALLGLEASRQYAHSLIDGALQALALFDNKAEPLRAIATYIIERKR
jgi:geranylgeranyl diphosphate synthase, type II